MARIGVNLGPIHLSGGLSGALVAVFGLAAAGLVIANWRDMLLTLAAILGGLVLLYVVLRWWVNRQSRRQTRR